MSAEQAIDLIFICDTSGDRDRPGRFVIKRYYSFAVPESACGRDKSGSLVIFAAIAGHSQTRALVQCTNVMAGLCRSASAKTLRLSMAQPPNHATFTAQCAFRYLS